MSPVTPRRLALLLAAGAVLALPGVAAAAEPTPAAPPAAVVDWQTHLEQMKAMDGPFGAHVRDCVSMHGSAAGLFGPNGSMAGMTGDMVMR